MRPAKEEPPPVWPVEALAGADMQIFGLLRRVVEIGVYRGTWGELDVARVASMLCDARVWAGRAVADARRRIDVLEKENVRLRDQVTWLESGASVAEQLGDDARVIVVSPLRARIVREAVAGRTPLEIGRMLGMSRDAVARHIERAAKQMETKTWSDGLALVASGEVVMVVKIGKG